MKYTRRATREAESVTCKNVTMALIMVAACATDTGDTIKTMIYVLTSQSASTYGRIGMLTVDGALRSPAWLGFEPTAHSSRTSEGEDE